MYNPLSDSAPRTQYVSEMLSLSDMLLVAGQNRTRKLGTISSGTGIYTANTNDIIISLDCNQPGKILNLANSYLVADITNTNAEAIKFQGKGGTHMIISELTISTNSGVQFSYFRDYNVLMGVEMAKSVDINYLDSYGRGMFGLGDGDFDGGAQIAADGTKTFIIPFCLSNFIKQVVPMWGIEQLQIRIKIANARTVYIGDASLESGEVQYSNLKFVYESVEIPPESFNKFVSAKNNTFVIAGKDWYSTSSTIPEDNTAITIQIPINRACISKVIAVLRTTVNILDPVKVSVCSRNRSNYTESYLMYNGVSYPLLTVKSSATSVAEMLAELMISNGKNLLNVSGAFINDTDKFITAAGAATSNATTSYGFYEFSLESGLENNDTTYSGLRVDNSTLSLVLAGGSAGVLAQTCNIFVEFQSKYTLSNGLWKVEY